MAQDFRTLWQKTRPDPVFCYRGTIVHRSRSAGFARDTETLERLVGLSMGEHLDQKSMIFKITIASGSLVRMRRAWAMARVPGARSYSIWILCPLGSTA